MESKLKALKVVDLRAILTKVEQPAPAKSNKQDLISRILASKEALEAYKNEHEKSEQDDLLAPPEDLDWIEPNKSETTKPESINAETTKVDVGKVETAKPEPTTSKPADAPTAAPTEPTVDVEEEKRRKRAERFGIKYEPARTTTNKSNSGAPPVDADKLKARAARFGIAVDDVGKRLDAPSSAKKRASPAAESPTAEEVARKKKRAERFGLQTGTVTVDEEEKKRREARAQRFGTKV